MRFEIVVSQSAAVREADGVPPDEMYPEYFVDDDGWIWPASAVHAFRRVGQGKPRPPRPAYDPHPEDSWGRSTKKPS